MSDRASRLRERRNRSKEKVQSQAESESGSEDRESEESKPSKTSKTEKTSKTGETDSSHKSTSLKDEQVGTYLYLPEEQRDEMNFRYKIISAEYEREFGESLEKNRHHYPLVIEYGLDRLESATPEEVQELLEKLEY
ncbi:hypothetical protein [Natronococcus jeotgali]|uniref:DUF8160 domain-containing protein n=1 Tax=Natronococcus jeotgali DSM 18795 TaxID=1227498 RepID=L9XCC1_9EURY|nr:hypothetical protein [Natronococcus jeotgali]ELY59287.1 hypothetical protein C492_11130 [Natronococcus jeotgali DSM 18795]